MADYDIWHIYDEMEKYITNSMSRNLKRHEKEEAKIGKDYEQWQAAKLREMRKFRKQNKAIIGGATKRLPKDIQQHLLNEYRQGLVGVIKKYKEKFGDTALTRSIDDGFFGMNDKKIQALIDAVNNDLQAANHAALRMANDAYRQTIHKAAMFAANGVTTEGKAVELAVADFAKRGLNCIKYSNGARHNIKEYSEMALRTAETRAMLMGEGKARQELGETLVLITKHGTACPLCVPFEGKVLIDDVYSGGTWENSKEAYEKVPQAKRAGVRFMSEAMKEGLYHPRCRHGLGTFYIELLDEEPKRIEYPVSKPNEKTIDIIMAEESMAKQEKAEKEKARDIEREIKTPAKVKEIAERLAAELESGKKQLIRGRGDPITAFINSELGYDGFPEVLPAPEFEKLAKDKAVLYRGLKSKGELSAGEMIDAFKYGDFFAGRGIYGYGTYTTMTKETALNSYSDGGKLLEMILTDDAKIANFEELYSEYDNEFGITKILYDKREIWQHIVEDVGKYASLKGYDAINCNGFFGSEHDYVLILNRSKVIVKE